MPLHLTYRPKDFKQVIGNEETVESLKTILNREDKPHAYLFTGPSGCGKTTLGRILAKKLGCHDYDFKEINASDFRGIDTVREIIQQMKFKPMSGSCKIWLIDECHMQTKDAMNAILKALEDTPPWVYFILCTTDPQNLLDTIKTRCTGFSVDLLSEREIIQLLNWVLKSEGVQGFPQDAVKAVASLSLGSPRAALVILDKIIDLPDDKLIAAAESLAEKENQVIEICRILLDKKPKWERISKIINGLKVADSNPETVRRAILGYLTSVLLKSGTPKAAFLMTHFMEPYFHTGKAGLALSCFMATQVE